MPATAGHKWDAWEDDSSVPWFPTAEPSHSPGQALLAHQGYTTVGATSVLYFPRSLHLVDNYYVTCWFATFRFPAVALPTCWGDPTAERGIANAASRTSPADSFPQLAVSLPQSGGLVQRFWLTQCRVSSQNSPAGAFE